MIVEVGIKRSERESEQAREIWAGSQWWLWRESGIAGGLAARQAAGQSALFAILALKALLR